MTYEDVAQWVLEQQRNVLLDEASSVRVMARTWKDETFNQDRLYSPKTVIKKERGLEIPAEIEIKVFEETARTLYIVLPKNFDQVEEDDFGVSNQELEALVIGCVFTDINSAQTQSVPGCNPGGDPNKTQQNNTCNIICIDF